MTENAKSRMRILYLLQLFYEETDEENSITVPRIIERMKTSYGIDVKRRAVYDDIEALRNFGLDIVHR